jgi:hypothetical protein
MLTLSKVVVEVGSRADAARAGDYRLELAAAPEAFARSEYQLAEQGLERRADRGSSSRWCRGSMCGPGSSSAARAL